MSFYLDKSDSFIFLCSKVTSVKCKLSLTLCEELLQRRLLVHVSEQAHFKGQGRRLCVHVARLLEASFKHRPLERVVAMFDA